MVFYSQLQVVKLFFLIEIYIWSSIKDNKYSIARHKFTIENLVKYLSTRVLNPLTFTHIISNTPIKSYKTLLCLRPRALNLNTVDNRDGPTNKICNI